MRFEEILPLMREGKKAYMETSNDGTYWICGKQGNEELGMPIIPFIFEVNEDNIIINKHLWGMPFWAIMAEDWAIFE